MSHHKDFIEEGFSQMGAKEPSIVAFNQLFSQKWMLHGQEFFCQVVVWVVKHLQQMFISNVEKNG